MFPRTILSFLLLTSIAHGRPIESPRDDAQQVETVPFIGVDPTDPRMAHGPDGLRPASAAMAMIIGAAQPQGHDAPGTLLAPYERPHTTPTAPTHLFFSPASTHVTASATPSLRASESTSGVNPAPQSNTSQRNVLVLAIVVSTVLGLLVSVTIGKYTLEYLQKAKRKLRLSQESWGHKERPFPVITPEVPVPDTDTEHESLRTFSFPGPPSRKGRLYDSNDTSKPKIRTRFSNLIAYTAFRHRDHDSVTTQDTASSTPYLLNVPGHSDHSRTRSAPIITNHDSMSTVKPAKSTESDWDIARSYRISQASENIPCSLVPSRGSRLSRLDTTW
ncbi:hypothetical protein DEU56DRAFT_914549 [Suillus clintonianus]|uniref:uncharacterized protein n=1 Tax=Suillus clintonianus TaxID=1904413 RepID=UPI001B870E4F|nr:uncharacterized protein DEU56DRAFT_914549 [Suillus clintonianus]KAG2131010.1 hypothetical protein DEU56DRAFT_914549 [Suillus clintonianus]